jgi:hypothetical protein
MSSAPERNNGWFRLMVRSRSRPSANRNCLPTCLYGYPCPGMVSGVVKSLWASVQGDPVFMRRVNGWLTIFWVVMIPVSVATGWVRSVVYVSALSLWALVSGHWAAWQAARVEVEQQRQAAKRARIDVPGQVVDRLVEETSVSRT